MQIAYHMGANCTDEDRLLKSILKNNAQLSERGIKAPGPGRYRALIRETIQQLDGATPDPDARQVLLDAIVDAEDAKRLVMSNANFICVPNRIFDHGVFYEQIAFKLRGLISLFPDDEIELFLGLRDPATFLPATFAEAKSDTLADFLQDTPLGDIRWSDVIRRIRDTAPSAKLTVWCNEDTPLIWGEVMRRICGLAADDPVDGALDLLATIMTPDGMSRLTAYLQKHPPKSPAQERKIVMAFLDKYALPDALEEVIDLPGLDAEIVDALSAAYDADVNLIADMTDVTFIAP
ncbi:hypothetical protein AB3Y40_09660 [Yoonia sp. R2331]|uniref:hypothetical protein n=1 Tax=Yoonia sp. R2331 TaxID=3237238 RepID=UPI0034E5B8E7